MGGTARELALDMAKTIIAVGLPDDAGASGIDAWGRLEEVHAPATLAWGDLDVPFGIATQTVAERLPRLRATEVIAGTAHLPYLERPDAVAGLVARAAGLPPSAA